MSKKFLTWNEWLNVPGVVAVEPMTEFRQGGSVVGFRVRVEGVDGFPVVVFPGKRYPFVWRVGSWPVAYVHEGKRGQAEINKRLELLSNGSSIHELI